MRHKWSSKAIREANGASASAVHRRTSDNPRCSESVCVGPHPSKDCWSKPENHEKRDKFLARRRGQLNVNSSASTKPSIKGIKKVNRPSANASSSDSFLSFHTHLEDDSGDESTVTGHVHNTLFVDVTAEASAAHEGDDQWALHDTGATHHVFREQSLFFESLFKANDTSSKRL